MVKKGTVELPDMDRVRIWFDANKPDIKIQIQLQHIPDTSDVKISATTDSDEMQWVLIMEFCMALRAGKV